MLPYWKLSNNALLKWEIKANNEQDDATLVDMMSG
jgi:hypothetical protein